MAIRDIRKGEEITENYGHYTKNQDCWAQKVFEKYLPSRLRFEVENLIKRI